MSAAETQSVAGMLRVEDGKAVLHMFRGTEEGRLTPICWPADREPPSLHDVGTWRRLKEFPILLDDFDVWFVDECHCFPYPEFRRYIHG